MSQRKIHYFLTLPKGAQCPAIAGRVRPELLRMVVATDPRDVTCLICRYHLGLHKPQRQLPFPRERKGCSAPGKGWKM